MTELTASAQVTGHRGRWKWFLALGVVLLVLGISGISATTFLQLTTQLVFGPLLLISSLMQLMIALFQEKGRGKEALLHFAAAGLEAVFGFFIMAHPVQNVVSLIALVAIFLVLDGLLRLCRLLAMPSRGRAWIVLTGVIALVLGIAVWIGWPTSDLWIVGLCIAVDFLCHGICWSAVALAERKFSEEIPREHSTIDK